MKIKKIFIGIAVISLMGSCVSRTDEGEKAKADYDRALSDSIEIIRQEIDSCDSQISMLRSKINGWVGDFTTVSNPREAGSYMILNSFKNKYPLSSTGLVARINDNGQFELVAALSGKPFDCIVVQGPADTATSSVVPNDQALNYRTAALTTVLFTGPAADSIGGVISDNELNPLKVTYMQGKPVQTWNIPAENARMIAYTYRFYKSTRELSRLERRVPMLHEKINLIRLHKDRSGSAQEGE